MKQPMIKVDELDEADLEYGNQRKAMMDIKEDLASVRCMVTNITIVVMGWVCGAFMFSTYLVYSRFVCNETPVLFLGTDWVLIKPT